MCGIAAIIQPVKSDHNRADLEKMTNVLSHRGPDGTGHWQNSDESVLLGHTRLAIIDLTETGNQPMLYLDRYHIIHNGEIYNYRELREELSKKGYAFRSTSDTEVIAAAYDHWEDECVDYFDGMFAFVIWDEKENKLFAARDRFGEKSLYYYYDNRKLLIASEMKALWAAGIPRIPNLQMLFNFITIGYTDNPEDPAETFYNQVHRLPAATTLSYSFSDKQLILESYWDLDSQTENKNISDAEAMEKFRFLLQQSVSRRMRSDVRLGTSLSGGLDSSSIAAGMHTIGVNGYSPHAFTAIFPGFEKDESAYAGKVADQFGMSHSTVTIQGEDLMNDWDKLCYHQEEPFGSASVYAQYRVFEMAKQQGVKVLLDGQGADETLAGYLRYYKWYWQELFRARKLRKSGEVRAAQELGIRESFSARNMIAAYFPDFATIVMEKQYLLKALRHEDLTRDFVRKQSKEAYYTAPSHFTLNGVLYFNTCTHGLGELLRYADRNSMAHGREVRLPFLSHELVEFVFTLPANFKIRNGWTKWLLRETMKDQLPQEITWRKNKIGFEPPQEQWMNNAQVREAIHESKRRLVEEKILKKSVLEKPVTAHAAHTAKAYDWRYLATSILFK